MGKRIEKIKQSKTEMYQNILTDPYFYPATKVLLMYLLELKGVYYLETPIVKIDDSVKEDLHLSSYHWNRAIKQLKEIEMVED